MANVRRVITGEKADGTGYFAQVSEVKPLVSEIGWYGAWGWDETPKLPIDPTATYEPRGFFPPLNGVRITFVEFPPMDDSTNLTSEGSPGDAERLAELRADGNRLVSYDGDTGMHKTDTIDIAFVVTGEIGVEQEDGTEVTIGPGDVLVQNGANHAWRNRSGAPCLLAYVIVGADRER